MQNTLQLYILSTHNNKKNWIHINQLVNNLACLRLLITCSINTHAVHTTIKGHFRNNHYTYTHTHILNVFYTTDELKCKNLIKQGKTSKTEPLPRKTMFSSNFTLSQINVCINARTVYIQLALHDCGNKALNVTTFSFRHLKKWIYLLDSHDKIVFPCML